MISSLKTTNISGKATFEKNTSNNRDSKGNRNFKPLVSVILTSYNQADLLAQAIRSVLNQTFQDFEVLVVDDGSQDHTLKVVETFRKESPEKILLYTHEGYCNKGIVSTYQLAFSKTRGEYVAFLEQDDRWAPNYLARKVKIFRTYPEVGVVFSPYKVVGKRGFGHDMMLRQWLLQFTIVKERPFNNFTNLIRINNVATFSCFATRKELLDKVPLPDISIVAYDWWVVVYLSVFSSFYYDKKSFIINRVCLGHPYDRTILNITRSY